MEDEQRQAFLIPAYTGKGVVKSVAGVRVVVLFVVADGLRPTKENEGGRRSTYRWRHQREEERETRETKKDNAQQENIETSQKITADKVLSPTTTATKVLSSPGFVPSTVEKKELAKDFLFATNIEKYSATLNVDGKAPPTNFCRSAGPELCSLVDIITAYGFDKETWSRRLDPAKIRQE
jgi:hypothetical protein